MTSSGQMKKDDGRGGILVDKSYREQWTEKPFPGSIQGPINIPVPK